MPNTGCQNSDLQFSPKQKDPGLSQDFWLTRGAKTIRRGSRGKVGRRSSDSGGTNKLNSGQNGLTAASSCSKAETTRAVVCSPITVLYVQGKSSSMSGCLNCFSTPVGKETRLKGPRSPTTLPRASSVISTAEGSSRRSSVNSDCRVAVKTELPSVQVSKESINQEEAASQKQSETDGNNTEPMPPNKPPRDPTVVDPTGRPKSPIQESLFGSSFSFNSVFSNTIFSDSSVKTSLDALDSTQTGLVQNCLPEIQESNTTSNTPQTLLSMGNEQTQNTEPTTGLEKDKPLEIA